MYLKPSEVFYSQDSISNRFGDYTAHGSLCIGETLDQLLNGTCNVSYIPIISVIWRNGKYFTTDNRRLWVFRKAEEIGFLKTIEVRQTSYINPAKFTTLNDGTSIRVRGNPGGSIWRTWRPKSSTKSVSNINAYYTNKPVFPREVATQYHHYSSSNGSNYDSDDHDFLRSPVRHSSKSSQGNTNQFRHTSPSYGSNYGSNYVGEENKHRSSVLAITQHHSPTSLQLFFSSYDENRKALDTSRGNSQTTSKPDLGVFTVERRKSSHSSLNNNMRLSKGVSSEQRNETERKRNIERKGCCTIL